MAGVNPEVYIELVRIRRIAWDVLACEQVLDFLAGEMDASCRALADGMLALLRRRVPVTGPPGGELSSDVGDDILEFRKQPKKGPKLRVLFFYDAGRIVVCTNAFLKAGRKLPPEEKRRAVAIRHRYFEAKARGTIRIKDIEEA